MECRLALMTQIRPVIAMSEEMSLEMFSPSVYLVTLKALKCWCSRDCAVGIHAEDEDEDEDEVLQPSRCQLLYAGKSHVTPGMAVSPSTRDSEEMVGV